MVVAAPIFKSGLTRRVTRGDAELVAACIGGDRGAWEEMIDRYGRLVWSVARRYGLTETDAEEVFQNVFVIVHRKLAGLREPGRLAGWLVRTTHRECYRVGASRWSASDSDPEDQVAPGEEEVASWERQQLVRDALRQLGGTCERLLAALFLAPGQPNYRAIADQLGMQIGSIGPTRARCFAKLEKILEEMGLPGD